MKNFIFKSDSKSDLYKILFKLDQLLKEQRMQRSDLKEILDSLRSQTGEIAPDYPEEELGSSDTEHGK